MGRMGGDSRGPLHRVRAVSKRGLGDYAVRFAFGAAIALVAGVLGMLFGPKLGGVFLGFPAILPASLTLIQKKDGKEQAAVDSEGAILGAIAFVVFAVVMTVLLPHWGVISTIAIDVIVWLAVALGLYVLTRAVLRPPGT